jgi:hypothetical protein
MIDLAQIIPLYIENGEINAAIKLCLTKAKADPEESENCYATVLELIDAI